MPRQKVKFQTFHDAYGMAYGAKIDRIAAERVWKRMTDKDKRAAIAGIMPYRDYCRSKGIDMKWPSGYLSLHRWEIEVVEESGTKKELSPTLPPSDALSDMDTW